MTYPVNERRGLGKAWADWRNSVQANGATPPPIVKRRAPRLIPISPPGPGNLDPGPVVPIPKPSPPPESVPQPSSRWRPIPKPGPAPRPAPAPDLAPVPQPDITPSPAPGPQPRAEQLAPVPPDGDVLRRVSLVVGIVAGLLAMTR